MSVVIETTLGDLTVDLFTNERPKTCLNFLKLCKLKYYNYNLFHTVQQGFIAQTGDPSGAGNGGDSIWGVLEGQHKRYFEGEFQPKIKHTDAGLLSMVSTGENMLGSQFFFTLDSDLTSLDNTHCVIGEVTEGHDVLRKFNEAICDSEHRPYQDIRITHTVILEDPFECPRGFKEPSRSPSPSTERLKGGRIAPDEVIDETEGKTEQEITEMTQEREAKARATILEIVGDLPDADMAPPENVLFVCKLNPVTTDDDLEIIFSRFGIINCCEVIRDKLTGDSLQYAFVEFSNQKSCEDAYFKMDNVLIDDRRIHVDFSQSVSRIKWKGKGRGVIHMKDEKEEENSDDKTSKYKEGNNGKRFDRNSDPRSYRDRDDISLNKDSSRQKNQRRSRTPPRNYQNRGLKRRTRSPPKSYQNRSRDSKSVSPDNQRTDKQRKSRSPPKSYQNRSNRNFSPENLRRRSRTPPRSYGGKTRRNDSPDNKHRRRSRTPPRNYQSRNTNYGKGMSSDRRPYGNYHSRYSRDVNREQNRFGRHNYNRDNADRRDRSRSPRDRVENLDLEKGTRTVRNRSTSHGSNHIDDVEPEKGTRALRNRSKSLDTSKNDNRSGSTDKSTRPRSKSMSRSVEKESSLAQTKQPERSPPPNLSVDLTKSSNKSIEIQQNKVTDVSIPISDDSSAGKKKKTSKKSKSKKKTKHESSTDSDSTKEKVKKKKSKKSKKNKSKKKRRRSTSSSDSSDSSNSEPRKKKKKSKK